MQFRHEYKHQISRGDAMALVERIGAVAQPDSHGDHGMYRIRSLYFDTPCDSALSEKINGAGIRHKYRIRMYNGDDSRIVLEKKSKVIDLCAKQSCEVTKQQVARILQGDIAWMTQEEPLLQELFVQMRTEQLQPKTIVEYTRRAFVYVPGNTRVTLDYHLKTGLRSTDFLNPACAMIPAADDSIILEVKYDAFLPDVICRAVQLDRNRSGAFSKYAACRMYD